MTTIIENMVLDSDPVAETFSNMQSSQCAISVLNQTYKTLILCYTGTLDSGFHLSFACQKTLF